MARKGKKGSGTPRKPKKPLKRKKKGKRKVNRYIAIRSAVSKYCREQYSKPCPEKEMNRIYWELKNRYGDVPIGRVLTEMDVILGNKDRDELPAELIWMQWYNLSHLLFRADGLYFRADDDIVLDLTAMGMDRFEGKYGEMGLIYRDKIYPTLRMRTYEAENNGWAASPQPAFGFNIDKSDVKGRKFVWEIEQTYIPQEELDNYQWRDSMATAATRKIPQKGVSSDAVRLAELRKEINAQREDALTRIDRMIDMGVITKAEYKKYYDDIMEKYNRGGVV